LVAIAAEVRDHKANAGRVLGTAAKTAPPPPPPAARRTQCPSGNVCPVDDFAQPLVVSIAVSPGDVPRQTALAFACVVSSISRVASAGGIGRQLGLGYIAPAQSVAAGYVTGGLTMLLALPSLLLLEDAGAGRPYRRAQAGNERAVRRPGFPAVSSVDTTPRQPAPSP
jgi:hypothetical protein